MKCFPKTPPGSQQRQSPKRISPEEDGFCAGTRIYICVRCSPLFIHGLSKINTFSQKRIQTWTLFIYSIFCAKREKKTISIRSITTTYLQFVRFLQQGRVFCVCFSGDVDHVVSTSEYASSRHIYSSRRCKFERTACFYVEYQKVFFFYQMKIIHTCSFLKGFTMAQYRSAARAVSVKTETPMDISFAHSDNLHNAPPHGQDSKVYIIEANGTLVTITRRSAKASENIYLKISKTLY